MPQSIPFDEIKVKANAVYGPLGKIPPIDHSTIPGGASLKHEAPLVYDFSKIRPSGPPIKNPCGEISVGPPQPLPVLTQSSFDDLHKEYKKKYRNLWDQILTRDTSQERHDLIDAWALVCKQHGVPYKHL